MWHQVDSTIWIPFLISILLWACCALFFALCLCIKPKCVKCFRHLSGFCCGGREHLNRPNRRRNPIGLNGRDAIIFNVDNEFIMETSSLTNSNLPQDQSPSTVNNCCLQEDCPEWEDYDNLLAPTYDQATSAQHDKIHAYKQREEQLEEQLEEQREETPPPSYEEAMGKMDFI